MRRLATGLTLEELNQGGTIFGDDLKAALKLLANRETGLLEPADFQ